MNLTYEKILVIVLVFLGESFAIYAEMQGARANSPTSVFMQVFWKAFIIMVIGGGLLVAGYMLAMPAFKNVWIVSVVSVTSIIIMEPLMAYILLKQLPTRGALIGFVLGALGMISAVFF